MSEKVCLWRAKSGRCSSCKASRIRADVLKMENFEMCDPSVDYDRCEFFKQKPGV